MSKAKKIITTIWYVVYTIFMVVCLGWAVTIAPELIQQINLMKAQGEVGMLILTYFISGCILLLLVYEVRRILKIFEKPVEIHVKVNEVEQHVEVEESE